MIFFLYGQNTLGSRRKLQEIITEYQKVRPGGLNLVSLDFSQDSFENFLEKAGSSSLFSAKKLLVLKNTFSNPGVCTDLRRFLEEKEGLVQNDILIFFESGNPPAGNFFLKWLLKKSTNQEFRPPVSGKLPAWVRKTVREQGGKISVPAAERLAEIFSDDLWTLDNEIKKLTALKYGQSIEIRDLESLKFPAVENNIFKTIDAIAARNKPQALKFLARHLEEGDSPIYLLSMIAYQLRNLVVVRQLLEQRASVSAMIRLTGQKPFVLDKFISQAQKFTLLRLKEIFRELCETDRKIKTGKSDPRQGLESLILSI